MSDAAQTGPVEPGEIALLGLAANSGHCLAPAVLDDDEHSSVGADVVQGEASRYRQDHTRLATRRDRHDVAATPLPDGLSGEPHLVAFWRPCQAGGAVPCFFTANDHLSLAVNDQHRAGIIAPQRVLDEGDHGFVWRETGPADPARRLVEDASDGGLDAVETIEPPNHQKVFPVARPLRFLHVLAHPPRCAAGQWHPRQRSGRGVTDTHEAAAERDGQLPRGRYGQDVGIAESEWARFWSGLIRREDLELIVFPRRPIDHRAIGSESGTHDESAPERHPPIEGRLVNQGRYRLAFDLLDSLLLCGDTRQCAAAADSLQCKHEVLRRLKTIRRQFLHRVIENPSDAGRELARRRRLIVKDGVHGLH